MNTSGKIRMLIPAIHRADIGLSGIKQRCESAWNRALIAWKAIFSPKKQHSSDQGPEVIRVSCSEPAPNVDYSQLDLSIQSYIRN